MAYEIQRFLDELQRTLGHKDSVWNTYNIQVFFSLCLYFLNQSENTLTVKGRHQIWFESPLFLHKTVYPKGWFTIFFLYQPDQFFWGRKLLLSCSLLTLPGMFSISLIFNESQSILPKRENIGNFQSSFGKKGPLLKQKENLEAAVIFS